MFILIGDVAFSLNMHHCSLLNVSGDLYIFSSLPLRQPESTIVYDLSVRSQDLHNLTLINLIK